MESLVPFIPLTLGFLMFGLGLLRLLTVSIHCTNYGIVVYRIRVGWTDYTYKQGDLDVYRLDDCLVYVDSTPATEAMSDYILGLIKTNFEDTPEDCNYKKRFFRTVFY